MSIETACPGQGRVDSRSPTGLCVAAAAALIDRIAGPMCQAHLAAGGEEAAAGAGSMYLERFRGGRVTSVYEPPLIAALLDWKDCPRRLIEVGGGIGGAAILAGAMGFDATCYEVDARRVATGRTIVEAIAEAFPGIAERVRFVASLFPPAQPVDRRDTLAFATNIAATVSDEVRRELIAAFDAFEWFVVDVDRFLRKAETREERARAIDRFNQTGARGEAFLDLGQQACFWRFEGSTHVAARHVGIAQAAAGQPRSLTPDLVTTFQDARGALPIATCLVDARTDDGALALLAAACGIEASWVPRQGSVRGEFDRAAAALAALPDAHASLATLRHADDLPAATQDVLCIAPPGESALVSGAWTWLQPGSPDEERRMIERSEASGRPALPVPALPGQPNAILLAPTNWSGGTPGPTVSRDHAILSLNRIAASVALERRRALGDASGVTGFYVSRAHEGSLLQEAEIAVADLVAGWPSSPERPLVEIGCGIGVLSVLLSTRGQHAIGIDHNPARIATARALSAWVATVGLAGDPAPRFEVGTFPAWQRKAGVRGGTALVTNLLGAADETRQKAFIAALAGFDRVVIDLQRFYTRRESPAEQAELLSWLRAEGFRPVGSPIDLGVDATWVVLKASRLPTLASTRRAVRRIKTRVAGRGASGRQVPVPAGMTET